MAEALAEAPRRSARGAIPTTKALEDQLMVAELSLNNALQEVPLTLNKSEIVGNWKKLCEICKRVKCVNKAVQSRYNVRGQTADAEKLNERLNDAIAETRKSLDWLKERWGESDDLDVSYVSNLADIEVVESAVHEDTNINSD